MTKSVVYKSAIRSRFFSSNPIITRLLRFGGKGGGGGGGGGGG